MSVADGGKRPRPNRRRTLLQALALGPLFGLPRLAQAGTGLVADLKRWGSGEFRRFGFLVYEATLWAGDDPQRPPLALRLDYRRAVEGRVIAAASVREMRRFVSDEALLQHWGEQMQRIFPDVQAGDHLLGVQRADGVRFYQHDRLLGTIATPGFGAAFFAIWLDERTSVPALRAALLQRQQG
jgi:hypothetical protein